MGGQVGREVGEGTFSNADEAKDWKGTHQQHRHRGLMVGALGGGARFGNSPWRASHE